MSLLLSRCDCFVGVLGIRSFLEEGPQAGQADSWNLDHASREDPGNIPPAAGVHDKHLQTLC